MRAFLRSSIVAVLALSTGCATTGGKLFGTAAVASGIGSVYLMSTSRATLENGQAVLRDDHTDAGAGLMFVAVAAASGYFLSEYVFGKPWAVGGGGGGGFSPSADPAGDPGPLDLPASFPGVIFLVNMFIKKRGTAARPRPAAKVRARAGGVAPRPPAAGRRPRGRPRGMTEQGAAARRQLYQTAVALIASRGYEATTLRDIAKRAGVSAGLLYRYFPNKRAVILALYDELSAEYAARAAAMRPGTWGARFLFALTTSLGVLAPQRATLAALTPVLIGTSEEGMFAPGTAFSRRRVQAVFVEAVRGASDAPGPEDSAALGRLLYVVHLAVILWWLFDKTPRQRATRDLLALLEGALPMAALALRLPPARNFVRAADILCREGLFGDDDDPASVAEAEKEEA